MHCAGLSSRSLRNLCDLCGSGFTPTCIAAKRRSRKENNLPPRTFRRGETLTSG